MDDYSALWSNISDPLVGSIWNLTSMSEHWNDQNWSEHQQTKQNEFAESQREGVQRYNTAEREASQAWQKWMWDNQNAYNAPVQQMQRMAAAGINPNAAAGLVAGQNVSSSVPGPTMQSSSPVSPGSAPSNSGFAPFGSQFASVIEAQAASRLSQSQARLNDSMAEKTQEETTGLIIDNAYKPFEKDADLSVAFEKIKLMEAQGELSHAQASSAMEMLPYLKGRTAAEIQQLNEDILNKSAERSRILESINLLSQQIETEKHKQKQMDAAAFEAYQNGKEAKSAIELNGKRMSLTEAETLLKTIEHDKEEYDLNLRKHFREKYGFDLNEHGVDRVLSNFGYVIERQGSALQSLWDSTKTKLNSIGSSLKSSLKSSLLPKENGYQPSEPYYER